jgi:hypothetical protein
LFVSSQACISDSFTPSSDNGLVFGLLYVLDMFLIIAACLSGRLWLRCCPEYHIPMVAPAGEEKGRSAATVLNSDFYVLA